ncbi:hypothetical protein BKA57DRAFT_449026 [Linnemannia elongata]|nr:hypothetical protein BKA57DRAFT_449026 [Linnemannia elongata]
MAFLCSITFLTRLNCFFVGANDCRLLLPYCSTEAKAPFMFKSCEKMIYGEGVKNQSHDLYLTLLIRNPLLLIICWLG